MMHIRMIGIPVDDPIKAFKHYTTILGFQKLMYDPAGQLAIVTAEDNDQSSIILEPVAGSAISKTYQSSLRAAGIPIITLSTANIQEEYIRLVNLNVHFKQTPTKTAWGTEAIFDDSCGNYIQLIEEAT